MKYRDKVYLAFVNILQAFAVIGTFGHYDPDWSIKTLLRLIRKRYKKDK